jgi:hypothetical protein
MNIKNQKTITISAKLNGINTFSVPIFLTFSPQFVIVKSVSVVGTYDTTIIPEVLLLKSSLVNYEALTHFTYQNILLQNTIFYASNTYYPNTTFKINNQPIYGNYDFQLLDSAGDPANISTTIIDIAFTLEFIEYN